MTCASGQGHSRTNIPRSVTGQPPCSAASGKRRRRPSLRSPLHSRTKTTPKKGVWNFGRSKLQHLLRLESSRHLFLGKAGRDWGSGGEALNRPPPIAFAVAHVSRGARRIANRGAPGRRPRCHRTRTARWPTTDKKRSCLPRALLVLANSCGQMRTGAVISGQNLFLLAACPPRSPSALAAYPGQGRTKWRRGTAGGTVGRPATTGGRVARSGNRLERESPASPSPHQNDLRPRAK